MSLSPSVPRGQLCIWTDVDPAHELDFNRWYDREHMQERVAIPGFESARRFHAIGHARRPYLALYTTRDLGVFTSVAYRQAFTQQTAWSLRNFARMRGTQRRVGELVVDVGAGEGGALAACVVPAARFDPDAVTVLHARLTEAAGHDHVVRASLLRTDPALSTPLTAAAMPAPADALLMIEATRPDVAQAETAALAAGLQLSADEVFVFQSLWRLGT